jgi:Ca2+-transporting ATPase
MDDPPRAPDARILSGRRVLRLFMYGLIMAVGTLVLFWQALPRGEAYALTLAWTTFVLFQFFNLFNARNEHGTAFNRQLFTNRWLWLSLLSGVVLQAVAVHWAPAQYVFDTTDLDLADWALAAAVASSVLVIDETRKLALRLFGSGRRASAAGQRRRRAVVKSSRSATNC